jgi:hypothetical protein
MEETPPGEHAVPRDGTVSSNLKKSSLILYKNSPAAPDDDDVAACWQLRQLSLIVTLLTS